ncbi:MAG TPA: alanine--tRNA ligase [Candidatus Saccharimonadales bacterium]|nr:alanine--tRNA ligase [Candidatus Saccharimonadales bacterium]
MTAQEIRKAYIDFFIGQKHVSIPRAQLVPQDDPTTLFTGSGMQPLIPYLLGEEHPEGVRLVDSQTCLRAQDIEEVGDNRHTTFFEMLGNWSLGDYFKKEQIEWFFEFLTEEVGLDANKLYVSCFIGSEKHNIARDEETAKIWQDVFKQKGIDAKIVAIGSQKDGDKKGMQGGRIFYYDDAENWWSRGGGLDTTPVGDPCGPDSEVFYDFGEDAHDESYGKPHPASDSGRFMEIGNQVFMQYLHTESGFKPLKKKNVDFGGGLERIAAAAIGSPDVFKISLLWPIIEKLEELSGKKYEQDTASMRVIADHLRGVVFLAVDGVAPSNKEQGYVARRLIRRAVRYAFDLGIEQGLCEQITPVIVDLYKNDFPEVAKSEKQVIETLVKEEKIFRQTLRSGIRQFEKATQASKNTLSGEIIFRLYDTYGFPVELSKEEAFKNDIKISTDADKEFEKLMEEQRKRSQTATKGVFKGGLVDHSDETKKLHTATHLMYEALRQVLGDHVVQRGSNVSAERTRFDFSHPEKVPRDKLDEVEKIVNAQIEKDLKVHWEEHPTEEAFKMGAKGAFGDKYGDKVKVYIMGEPGKKPFSIEICGGPHVEHTGILSESGKKFKITKEEASSAGVRRIKGVLIK